jgi:hypothetical protein
MVQVGDKWRVMGDTKSAPTADEFFLSLELLSNAWQPT